MNKQPVLMVLLLLLLLPGLLWAVDSRLVRKAPTPLELTGLEDMPTNLRVAYPPYPAIPVANTDLLGDTITVGTTWYDVQHNSHSGHMIVKDSDGYVQIVWTNGIDPTSANRHVYYNNITPAGDIGIPNGIQVDASTRAGFTCLTVGWENRAFPAFHQIYGGVTILPHSAVAVDYFPHVGAFQVFELPWFNGEDRPLIWPRIAMKQDGQMLIVSRENGTAVQTWSLGTYDPIAGMITYTDQEQTEDANAISNEAAASSVSNRTGIAYPATAFPELGYTDPGSDIHAMVDDDGSNFNFANWWNVTNFFPPDISLLPDTLLADADTLRAWADVAMFYDMNDVCHITFTTVMWMTLEGGYTYWNASCIWHWSEAYPNEYNLVARAWEPENLVSCGNWSFRCQRPSMGQDPTTGNLYVSYQQYDVDSTNLSAAGWPSSDVYITVSTDGGRNWAVGTNVTDTQTEQGALPGQCLSETYPSIAELVDEYCHLFYELDLDAGQAVPPASEGSVTFNPMKYHRVPVDRIAQTPLMDQYPFHVQHIADTTSQAAKESQPRSFALAQNSPNPFNASTTIHFSLPNLGYVSVDVYNLEGEKVTTLADGIYAGGEHAIRFDGASLASGIYLCRMRAEDLVLYRKMVLLK